MTTYIIRRLLLVPILLIGVTILIFGMMQLLSPVERTALYLKDFPKNDKAIEGLIKRYGFDKPVYVQYCVEIIGERKAIMGDSRHRSIARK